MSNFIKNEWEDAIIARDKAKMLVLINQGVDINMELSRVGTDFPTALHVFVRESDEQLVRFFIKYGANINSKTIYEHTPLDLTSNRLIKKILVENGATSDNPHTIVKVIAYELNDPIKAFELLKQYEDNLPSYLEENNKDYLKDESEDAAIVATSNTLSDQKLAARVLQYKSYIQYEFNTRFSLAEDREELTDKERIYINHTFNADTDCNNSFILPISPTNVDTDIALFSSTGQSNNLITILLNPSPKTAAQIISERTILQNPNLKEGYYSLLTGFENDPLLKDVISIGALHAIKHPEFLVTILYDNKSIGDPIIGQFMPGVSFARGVDDISQNLIAVACGNSIEKCFGTFMHELTHSAMNDVYRNIANPYSQKDLERKEQFEKMAFKTLTSLYKYFLSENPINPNCTYYSIIMDKDNPSLLDLARCGVSIMLQREDEDELVDTVEERILEIIDRACVEYLFTLERDYNKEFIIRLPQLLGEGIGIEYLNIISDFVEYWQNTIQPDLHSYICNDPMHNFITNYEC